VKISKEAVIALNHNDQVYYQQAMDSGDGISTFVPPFKLFPINLGLGPVDNWVTMPALALKKDASHYNLLCKLFSQLCTNPPSNLAHIQYALSCIATIIGHIKSCCGKTTNSVYPPSLFPFQVSSTPHWKCQSEGSTFERFG